MKFSPSVASLAPALVKAQSDLKAIGKDSPNPDFRSKYASLDSIIENVRPVLAKHGLALLQGIVSPDDDDLKGHLSTFAVESVILHQSGEWMSTEVTMPVVGRQKSKQDGGGFGDVTPQAAGSALTYGRRYGLAALLCLATDEDDDGNAASKQRPATRPETRQPTKTVTERLNEGASVTTETGPVAVPASRLVRGKKLGDYTTPELNEMNKKLRAEGKDTHKYILSDIVKVLNDRTLGAPKTDDERVAAMHEAADKDDAQMEALMK